MKKICAYVALILAAVIAAMTFAACGVAGVEGNFYVFDSVTVEGASAEEEPPIIAMVEEQYDGSTIEFGTDDTFAMTIGGATLSGTYTQNGSELTLTVGGVPADFRLSGNKLQLVQTMGGITVTVNFIKADKPENLPADGTTSDVAGKLFKFSDIRVDASDMTAAEVEELKAQYCDMFANAYIKFGTNGVFEISYVPGNIVTGTYTQNGNDIAMTAMNSTEHGTLEGNNFLMTDTDGSTTMTMILSYQSSGVGNIDGGNAGGGDSGQGDGSHGDAVSVAGRTYKFSDAEITSTQLTQEQIEQAEQGYRDMLADGLMYFGYEGDFKLITSSESIYGNYVQDGEVLTITANGSTNIAEVSGANNIIFMHDAELVKIVLKFTLTAEGGNVGTGDAGTGETGLILSGTYAFTDVILEDVSAGLTQAELEEAEASMADMLYGAYIRFISETECEVSLGGNIMNGSYILEGDVLTIIIEGDPEEFTLDGTTIYKMQEIILGDITGLSATVIYTLTDN